MDLILLTVDQQMDELQRWLPIYRELGWPTKLSQLGSYCIAYSSNC